MKATVMTNGNHQLGYTPEPDSDIPDAVYVEGTAEDVTKLVNDQETEEQELLQELGADERVVDIYAKIYQQERNNRNLTWLFDCTMADFPILERLRDQYGSGSYQARIYKNKKLYRQVRWQIKTPSTQNQPVAPGETAVNAAINQQGQLMGELVSIVHQMKQAPAPVVNQNPMDPTAMVQMFTAMMGAMQQMIPPPPKVESPLALMAQVVNMMKDIQSDGKEKGMFDIVSDFLKSPLLSQAVEQSQKQASQMYSRQAIAPAPKPSGFATNAPSNSSPSMMRVPAPTTESEHHNLSSNPYEGSNYDPSPNYAPQEAPQEISPDEMQFRSQLELLVNAAQRGADPDLYADLIEDQIPREMIDQFLMVPNPLEVLANYHPGVSQYADWFKRLLNSLTNGETGAHIPEDAPQHGTGPQFPDGNSQRSGGGTPNAQDDVPTGSSGQESPES